MNQLLLIELTAFGELLWNYFALICYGDKRNINKDVMKKNIP